MTPPKERAWLLDIPSMAYEAALALQHDLVERRSDGRLDADLFLLLEHPPVFTLGRRGGREFLRADDAFLAAKRIAVVPVERGGYITYHGPGQLVCYPVVDLRKARLRVTALVEMLETVMMGVAGDFDVSAERNPKNRGVWVGHRKLGSIGIAVRHQVSFHGFALNAVNSLAPFAWMDPCGLHGVEMTSLAKESDREITMADVRRSARWHLAQVFGRPLVDTTVSEMTAAR